MVDLGRVGVWVVFGNVPKARHRCIEVINLVEKVRCCDAFTEFGLLRLESEIGGPSEPPVEQVERLMHAFERGLFLEVSEASVELTKIYPKSAFIWKLLGATYRQQAQFLKAGEAFDRALALQKTDFEIWLNRGVTYWDMDKLDKSAVDFSHALCLDPCNFQAQINLAIVLGLIDLTSDSITAFSRAAFLEPNSAEASYGLGATCQSAGWSTAARAALERAIVLSPGQPAGWTQYGLSLRDAGYSNRAIAAWTNAVNAAPTDAKAIGHCAAHELDRKNFGHASRLFFKAVLIDPSDAQTLNNFGLLLQRLANNEAARQMIIRSIQVSPSYADAHNALGILTQEQGDIAAAEEHYSRAIAHQPDNAVAISNRGGVLWEKNNVSGSRWHFDTAQRFSPLNLAVRHNRCKALHECQLLEAAVAGYEEMICLFPDCVDVYWHLSLALLALGDYPRAWPLYEHRWFASDSKSIGARGPLSSLWTGREPLGDKRLLIYAEQGLGDTLQFCRYSKLLVERGARVITRVPDCLVRLFRIQGAFGEVVGYSDPTPSFDVHCPMMSLPLALKTSLDSIPFPNQPYLTAAPYEILRWGNWLDAEARSTGQNDAFLPSELRRRRLRVGLVWSGGEHADVRSFMKVNSRRNIPLKWLSSSLDIAGVDFVSLQKGIRAEADLKGREHEYWTSARIFNPSDKISDFSDTAGLMANIDLLITVDTSTAHLAAAMGKPVWLLNRYNTCWRWLRAREDSPWYGSLKIYRQNSDLDWRPVLARVGIDLQRLVDAQRDLESQ